MEIEQAEDFFLREASLALAYTEKQSRYDLADCRTTANKKGGGWVIDGHKVWVLNGHAADQLIVVARTGGGPTDEAGLSLFIVDGGAEGLTRTTVPGMDGQKSGLLEFSGVEVAADRLLGQEGAGFEPVRTWRRVCLRRLPPPAG